MVHDAPEALLAGVRGRVWEWVVPSSDLVAVRSRFIVSGTLRRSDGVLCRVISAEPPAPGARAVDPSLEDAYLHLVSGARTEGAA